jgi:lipopolysaccharide/colanic/teichoic acid biosynthesis glycosyltransferase
LGRRKRQKIEVPQAIQRLPDGLAAFGLVSTAAKRVIDLAIAVPGLVLLTPLMVAIACAVKLTSSGDVLFRQTRIGKDFKPFTILKFRSMRGDTRPLPPGFTLARTDPRITPIGHWLRTTSLDELPQLFNVVHGEMSLVGPRPLIEWESRECLARHAARFLVKPGLTGLQQVMVRNTVNLGNRSDWDVEYVHRWSLLLDLVILARTPVRLLSGEGVYEGRDDSPARQREAP